ncbi:hypothetical protein NSE_0118 [Neorickettsia sennetsu str. Miyayama]|uniref:Uncharacterized protein n=1 Tax=Ehrlichia sennetsu (strain ATCC VR-367 / Miyayama) TaxID=222891 RepID=Q2GES8_EHRS3|nr:hypothetical protein NSE_0118 [Neorickettsia sennetsu str. Miyayama]
MRLLDRLFLSICPVVYSLGICFSRDIVAVGSTTYTNSSLVRGFTQNAVLL